MPKTRFPCLTCDTRFRNPRKAVSHMVDNKHNRLYNQWQPHSVSYLNYQGRQQLFHSFIWYWIHLLSYLSWFFVSVWHVPVCSLCEVVRYAPQLVGRFWREQTKIPSLSWRWHRHWFLRFKSITACFFKFSSFDTWRLAMVLNRPLKPEACWSNRS